MQKARATPGWGGDSDSGTVPRAPRDLCALLCPWLAWAAALVWSFALLVDARQWGIITAPVLTLGVIGAWRYLWAALHALRAMLYLNLVFPQLRREARAVVVPQHVSALFGVVSAYAIPPDQLRQVFGAIIDNCVATGVPTTIVAAITSDRDCRILADLLIARGNPEGVRIIAQFQQGTGKRAAMAAALRRIAELAPDAKAVTFFLDGDVVLEPGGLAECLRFFGADPQLSALTTNNAACCPSGDAVRHWYDLRLAQRHLMMSSLALSRRLLVLTGRFSVYRAQLVVAPSFIAALEEDAIEHWLHGRIRFLSGDDKSMWHQVLLAGGDMLYLPHVRATAFEAMPEGTSFIEGSSKLMLRWFGNMVRANGRALSLGPRRCGPFLWWCLIDQRVSVVTTLLGISMALAVVASAQPALIVLFVAWVIITRSLASGFYGLVWGRFHPSWPVFLAYGQYWGNLLKLHLYFRPDRQSWTRQKIAGHASGRVHGLIANGLHVMALGTIVSVAAMATNALGAH